MNGPNSEEETGGGEWLCSQSSQGRNIEMIQSRTGSSFALQKCMFRIGIFYLKCTKLDSNIHSTLKVL